MYTYFTQRGNFLFLFKIYTSHVQKLYIRIASPVEGYV